MHRRIAAIIVPALLLALHSLAVGAEEGSPEPAPEAAESADVEPASTEVAAPAAPAEATEEAPAAAPVAPPARRATPALPPAVRDAIAETESAALVRSPSAAPSTPAARSAAPPAPAPEPATEPATELAPAPALEPALEPAPEPAPAGPVAPETTDTEDVVLAGLLAELDGTTPASDDVSIPTAEAKAGVNPMARATSAFLLALFVFAGLLAHPRSRAVVLERLRSAGATGGRGAPARIDVRSAVSLGSGHRVVAIETEGVRLLVGLSQGRMDVLHTWGDGASLPAAIEPSTDGLSVSSSLGALFGGFGQEPATAAAETNPTADQEVSAPAPVTPSPGVSELVAAWTNRAPEPATPKVSEPLLEETGELPWWLEGATGDERVRLAASAEAELDDPTLPPDPSDEAVAESVLAQLRVARHHEDIQARRERRPRLATLGRVADSDEVAEERPRRRGMPRAVLGLLFGVAGVATLGMGGEAFAADAAALALDLGADTLGGAVEGGPGASTAVKLLVTLTMLAVAPAIVLSMTSFTRLIVVFSLTRQAIGVQQAPPNQVLIGLALFLTWFVMGPTFERVGDVAVEPYFEGEMTEGEALSAAMGPMRDFMMHHTREKDLALMLRMAEVPRPETRADVPTRALVPAFMISELKTAFQIGFLIYIPFLIIDLVVATILLAMGMMVLPPVVISLPFKLLLFVFVDGWNMLVGSLVTSFA